MKSKFFLIFITVLSFLIFESYAEGKQYKELDQLINKYGKPTIISTIINMRGSCITIQVNNILKDHWGIPSPEYVNKYTILEDLCKIGISIKELEKLIIKKRIHREEKREAKKTVQESNTITQWSEKLPKESLLPTPRGLINDFAGIISPAYEEKMNCLAREILQKAGVHLTVVTLSDIGGDNIDEFTNRLYEKWGVGKKGGDRGLMILLALKEHKIRIEVGYGLEGIIPDGLAGKIIDKVMVPYLKKGEYAKGLFNGFYSTASVIVKDRGVKISGLTSTPRNPHSISSFLSNIWDKIDGKESIRKEINQIENRLEVIQKEIDRVITWRAKKLGDLHVSQSLITSRVLHGLYKEDEENINAEATKQLDKLINERDFLQKKLLLLLDKL